jgi:hypothetical protein
MAGGERDAKGSRASDGKRGGNGACLGWTDGVNGAPGGSRCGSAARGDGPGLCGASADSGNWSAGLGL